METVGAGARKVRLLLRFAQVECRPSLAPPITMDLLSSVDTHKAISLNAHCLLGPNHPMLISIYLASETGSEIFWAAHQHSRNPGPLTHIQRKLSTIAKTTVLSAKSLKTLALKGQGRHRLTWRRLCLPCQASAIYEFDLSQDLLWHFAPEQSPTP